MIFLSPPQLSHTSNKNNVPHHSIRTSIKHIRPTPSIINSAAQNLYNIAQDAYTNIVQDLPTKIKKLQQISMLR